MKPVIPEGPFVSTEWLASHLDEVRVVDIRGKVLPPAQVLPGQSRYRPKREEYDAGHLPGAVFVDWTKDIVDPDDPVPAQIARPDAFAKLMESLGIGDDTIVVTYDDYDMIFAGRLAWGLRYYGHDAVRVLDGGFTLWAKEGRPITREIPHFDASKYRFTPRARPEMRKLADQVAAAKDAILVDARPADQFDGTNSAAKRHGHIPGAKNVPYASLVDPATGKLRGKDELRAAFQKAGIDVASPREIICYCNGGVSATVPLHALHVLGRTDASLYDGSWNEWGNDASRPIE